MIRKFIRAIRTNILVGIFLTVPLVLTVVILGFLLRLATQWLPASMFAGLRQVRGGAIMVQSLTLLFVLLLFYLVGLLTRNMIGRRVYQLGDRFLTRIPLIRNIYLSVRQISEALFTQRKTLFREVVLIEYPRKGIYSIGFVTAGVPPRVRGQIDALEPPPANQPSEPCLSVFLPTTPNPTSGFLLFVPKSRARRLDISVGDAVRLVMSGGAVAPGEQHQTPGPSLLDRLESWLRHEDA